MRWRINLLSVGEEDARALGVNTGALRLVVIVCSTLVTAASVAVSGMIGWVGLVIPHLCRKLVGNDCRYLLPASMVFGALFLLLVDNACRNLLATEIPIGILTACIGAPFFRFPYDAQGCVAIMLEVHKLCFAFRQREVFANVSFRAEPGELLGCAGP